MSADRLKVSWEGLLAACRPSGEDMFRLEADGVVVCGWPGRLCGFLGEVELLNGAEDRGSCNHGPESDP